MYGQTQKVTRLIEQSSRKKIPSFLYQIIQKGQKPTVFVLEKRYKPIRSYQERTWCLPLLELKIQRNFFKDLLRAEPEGLRSCKNPREENMMYKFMQTRMTSKYCEKSFQKKKKTKRSVTFPHFLFFRQINLFQVS